MCDHPSCHKIKQTTEPSPAVYAVVLDTEIKGAIFTFPNGRANLNFENFLWCFTFCFLFPWRQCSFNPHSLIGSHSAGLISNLIAINELELGKQFSHKNGLRQQQTHPHVQQASQMSREKMLKVRLGSL